MQTLQPTSTYRMTLNIPQPRVQMGFLGYVSVGLLELSKSCRNLNRRGLGLQAVKQNADDGLYLARVIDNSYAYNHESQDLFAEN